MAKTIKGHDKYKCIRDDRKARKSLRKRHKKQRTEKRIRNKGYTTGFEIGTCGRKRYYPSKAAAELSASYVQAIRDRDVLVPYHCQLCGGWHLTSHPEEG
jgi:hypothetical protein